MLLLQLECAGGAATLPVTLWHKLSRVEAREEGYCRKGTKVQVHGVSEGVSALVLVDLDYLRCGGSQTNWRSLQRGATRIRNTWGSFPGVPRLPSTAGWHGQWSEPSRGHQHHSYQAIGQATPATPLYPPEEDDSATRARNHRAAPPTPNPEKLFLICSLRFRC